MEYLDENGLQLYLNSLYNSLNINNNNNNNTEEFDYSVYIDGVRIPGDVVLESDLVHPGFYIVRNIKVVN